MNILLFGASASIGTGYGILQKNIGSRLHKLGKKKIKCNDCNWETYIEPKKNKCAACDSENIKVIEEADKEYKGPYYNVFQMGLHTIGYIDNRCGFPILPVGSNDPCGSDLLPYYIMQYNIDVLITAKDIFPDTFNYIKDVVRKTNVYWIHHCTIYSTPLSPFRAKALNYADLIIAPSNFSYQVIKNAGYDNVKRIYHGVDLDVFKPDIKQKEKDREEVKTEKTKTKGKFIFLIVAKNVVLQKDYPTLFHAYELFLQQREIKCNKCSYEFDSNELDPKCTKCSSKDIKITENRKKNTILHCHANPKEIGGYDLDMMANRFGIIKNVVFTKGHNSNFTLPPERMAEIYNYGDVVCICSTGESFGLPLIEGMACGKPVIAMRFSAPIELINNSGAGLLADIKGTFTTRLCSDLCINNELSYAKCMNQLYSDAKLRERLSKNALNFSKGFSWSIIVKEWIGLLR